MNTTRPTIITLEEIARRKAELKLQLDKQRSIIISTAKQTFAPTAEESSLHPLMMGMNRGLAIYDGVLTGIKIMRRIKYFFRQLK